MDYSLPPPKAGENYNLFLLITRNLLNNHDQGRCSMKKTLLLLIALLAAGRGFTREPVTGVEIESLTPSSAILFLKTSPVRELASSLKEMSADFSGEKELKEFFESLDEIRDKTGIDIRDSGSLKDAGIDIERRMGAAFFKNSGRSENIIIFLPVADEKKFPLKFVEIIKDMNKENRDLDIYPAITSYGKSRIYQIRKDVFYTVTGGYFLIAPTGEILKKSIDLGERGAGRSSSLESDRVYSGYRDLLRDEQSVRIFATREMLTKAFKSASSDLREPGTGGAVPGMVNQPPFLDAMEFGAAGINYSSRRLKVSLSTSFNRKDLTVNSILDVIKTGLSDGGLYLPGAHYNLFLSLDLEGVKKFCSKPTPVCSVFQNGIREMEREYGLNYNRDIVPNFTGGMSVIFKSFNPGSGDERFVLFFPLKNKINAGTLYKKMRSALERKYRKEGKYGDNRIGKRSAFWPLDRRGKKRYYLPDGRGLYMGSEPGLLKWALNAGSHNRRGEKSIYRSKTGPEVFFLLNLKKESFLSTMIKMKASRNRELKNSMKRIGDVYLRGARRGNFLSIDLDLEVTGK